LTPRTLLESLIDPFVKGVGGELVSELVSADGGKPPTQADYFFRTHETIVELKALERPSFGDTYVRKLSDLTVSWFERGLFLAYGTTRIDLRRLSPICQQEWLGVLTQPVQDHVVAAANRQLAATKRLLGVPKAKGILWLASDGNLDLRPHDVWFLLSSILRKTKPDGTKQYSNIDGIIYFHPRVPATVTGVPGPVFFWFGEPRDPESSSVREFIERLRQAWIPYFAASTGMKVVELAGEAPEANVRFAGSVRSLPRVSLEPAKKS